MKPTAEDRLTPRFDLSSSGTAAGPPSDRRRRAAVRSPRYPSLSDDHYPPLISPRLIAALLFIVLIIALLIRG